MSTIILNAESGANIKLIAELARKLNIDVLKLSKKELEAIEDLKLLGIMQEAREEGIADRKETMGKLKL